MHKKGVAQTFRTYPMAQKIFFFVATISIIISTVVLGIRGYAKKVDAEKVGGSKAKEFVKAYPPTAPPVVTQKTTEALVLEKECFTPCSGFVGWSYKVRTNGDPVRVSNQNYSWDLIDKWGVTPPPKGFKPGEAEIVSLDKKNSYVKVWVYKKITVPIQ